MALPFYVSPEQIMKDKSDYARKGIARGKSVIALEYDGGILFVAENPWATLHKISEIYDRIALAGVGRFNEFETLRMHGIRQADIRGFSYSREDVSARGLANAYSQILGQIFSESLKPFEVEILVAAVGGTPDTNEMYHILYDGSVAGQSDHVAMGGKAEALNTYLSENFTKGALADAMKLGTTALSEGEQEPIPVDNIEVALLDRSRDRRKFRRLSDAEVTELLG